MKIKKLEIHGFKSFQDKCAIDFPTGVSAVVGPNGCGKSNIVDALRWVMGEQSVKQLRGKNMEDIIFAGANGKPPLNMAEVTLTLANDNGSAPEELKDFTEIALTRRLYRSGESAYLMNKRPCRLKDIHNVFLGSGMGARSYALIQQGNIGAITEAGPDERRVFIEEAAGVTRFKNRKKEALSKIKSTNQNLLRVNDIITEVKRQMDGLKRQARKAERFKKLQHKIKGLDIHLGVHYFDDYTQKINEADELLKNLKDEDLAHSSQLQKLDAAIEDIKLQRSRKNQQIGEQKSRKFETQRSIDRMETELEHLRAEITRLSGEIEGLGNAKTELENKNRNIETEITQVEEESAVKHGQIEQVRVKLEQERAESQQANDQLKALTDELENAKASLMQLVTQEAQYKNLHQNATNNKESLKRRLRRADEEEALAGRKVNDLATREKTAQQELEEFKTELAGLDEQIASLREALQTQSTLLGQQVKHVQTIELERNKAKSQYNALKKMEDNFEWYRDGVKAIMQRTGDEQPQAEATGDAYRADGVIGLLADILEPQPTYEVALEAVLGDSLQYIIVQDQTAGHAAIDYLQQSAQGRGGFIPMTAIKPACDAMPQPDSALRLLNHVKVKEGYQTVAEALLGHVVVAGDREQARTIFQSNGKFQTIVTLTGEILSHQGLMMGGSQENLAGIMAKKQEIRDLAQSIETLNQQAIQAHADQTELEAKVRRLESDLQQNIEQRNYTVENETAAEKALYKISEELKHARRHLEIIRLEQEQLMGEECDIDDEISKVDQALQQVADEVRAAQDTVSRSTEAISSVNDQVQDYNQRLVELKLEMTSLTAAWENSRSTLKRLKDFAVDGRTRLTQIETEIDVKSRKLVGARQTIEASDRKLKLAYEELQQLDSTLQSNEHEYQTIDSELQQHDRTIADIQSNREETLQKIRLIEIEQSQRQIKRENIANRLQEKYHQHITILKADLQNRAAEDVDEAESKPAPPRSIKQMEEELTRYRKRIASIGDVNLGAIEEFEQYKERFDFLNTQREDLIKAIDDLHKVIKKINHITQKKFVETFNLINDKLKEVFPRLFEGGMARLDLTEPNNPLETGVEYMIHPPGKKLTRMSLLSGGEKALSAIAFIFAIFLIRPASFCLMDEIDAPLDEANVHRFNNLLKLIGEKSQIIMITHNKKSMEFADTLFGVTMEQKGISKLVSVNFEKSAVAA